MSSKPTNLLWIDIETTGLDTRTDHLLEVACFITDPDGNDPRAFQQWIIHPTDPTWYDRMIPFVRDMHENSGLISDINNHGIPLSQFLDEFGLTLQSQVAVNNGEKLVMAGSGVGPFDRIFFKEQFPLFENYLEYYVIDVGVIGRFLRYCMKIDFPERPSVNHRAFQDIQDHYNEFLGYCELLVSRKNIFT